MTLVALATLLSLTSASAFDEKDAVKAALKKLTDAENHSWTAAVKDHNEPPEAAQKRFFPAELSGKSDKQGYNWLTMKIGTDPVDVVWKGDKRAVKIADGWKGAEEIAPGPGKPARSDVERYASQMLRTMKTPSAEMDKLIDAVKELKSDGAGLYSGEFTEEGAREAIFPGRKPGQGPEVKEPKGSAKFWVKDGVLVKMEMTLTAKIVFREQERPVNKTNTVEFKDVGSSKIEIPDEAKKKIE